MVTRILVRTPIPRKKETASAAKADESNRDYNYKQKDDGSNTNNKCNPVREQVKKTESSFCSNKGCPHDHEKAANGKFCYFCDGNLCHDVPPPLQGKPSNNDDDKIAARNEVTSCQQNDDNDTASRKRPLLMDNTDDASEMTKRRKKFIDLSDVPPQLPITSSKIDGSSKYKGVSFNKARNKWRARIKVGDTNHFIGYYENEEKAGIDYARAVFKYKTGKQNFIELTDVKGNGNNVTSNYNGAPFSKARKKWLPRFAISRTSNVIGIGHYDNKEEAAVDNARAVFKCKTEEGEEELRMKSMMLKCNGWDLYLNQQGVFFNPVMSKWIVMVIISGMNQCIGYYDTAQEASIAYSRYRFA